jgi:hypothetical protein
MHAEQEVLYMRMPHARMVAGAAWRPALQGLTEASIKAVVFSQAPAEVLRCTQVYSALPTPHTLSHAQLHSSHTHHTSARLSYTIRATDVPQVGGVLPGGLRLRGLSGGERRRLSVAIGVLPAPSLIFLDEVSVPFACSR